MSDMKYRSKKVKDALNEACVQCCGTGFVPPQFSGLPKLPPNREIVRWHGIAHGKVTLTLECGHTLVKDVTQFPGLKNVCIGAMTACDVCEPVIPG